MHPTPIQGTTPSKLRLAVPEFSWSVDAAGIYSIHFDDALALFGGLLDLPAVKDPTWTGVWTWWERVVGTLALCWRGQGMSSNVNTEILG